MIDFVLLQVVISLNIYLFQTPLVAVLETHASHSVAMVVKSAYLGDGSLELVL